jgi:putative ABC transport system permease protein
MVLVATPSVETTSLASTGHLSEEIARSSSSTLGRLVRFALANIARRPERVTLAVLGIALAIMSVTVVRTISASFANTGSATVETVLDGASLWVVPPEGAVYDPDVQAIVSLGPAPDIAVPAGWSATRTVVGVWRSGTHRLAVYGDATAAPGRAVIGSQAADELGLSTGDDLSFGGRSLTVKVTGDDRVVRVPASQAARELGDTGWWTLKEPASEAGRKDLGAVLSTATGLPSTTNPATTPDASGKGLIYDAVGGSSTVTFDQKYSAMFSGKVTGSTLGLISTIGLVLGFVIAVTSFLSSVQERRREFGIMSSIGLADEVLYFFLVESAIVFLVSYVVGVAVAGVAVAVVIPGIATPLAWAQAAGTVAAYLPAMAIVGALVPVHHLLQQRPVELLADAA